MTDDDKIRVFENDVLDQHYKSYLFYQYSDDIVIPYLLQVYGDTERQRDNLIRKGDNPTNLSFYLNNMLHGLGHCIRWMINKEGEGIKDISKKTFLEIHEMSADFLGWGTGYHMIAQEFVTWSRGLKTAILNEEKKEISFINAKGYEFSRIYKAQLLYAERVDEIYNSYPHKEMHEEFSEWIKEIDFSAPPIFNYIKWQRGKISASYPLLYLKMREILFPELDETTDFQGYNLQELRQFYATVFLIFYFIRWAEGKLDSHVGNDNLSFGSNPLESSKDQFEKLISNMTGLPVNVSAAIISDLTFDPSSFHTSVSIQPFIRSHSGNYHILPNLFAQLEPSRMILGALNKGTKKRLYSNLINIIEKVNLKLLYNTTKGIIGSVCHLEKHIKNNNQTITPDLIIIDTSDKFVLVADYKHFIGPITASEVNYKMKELDKGFCQVTKYIDYLSEFPKIGSVCIKDYFIVGMVITHKLLPIPTSKENLIAIIDLQSFINEVRKIINHNKHLRELAYNIQSDFLKKSELEFKNFESEIKVNDWTIKRIQSKVE